MNREKWLTLAAENLSNWLVEVGETRPEVSISVGFPGGRANRNRTVGQCWKRSCSAREVNQIYISPIRGEEDTVAVLATVLHELIHAVDDCESGHRGNFIKIARKIGLVPKWTTSTPGEELKERLEGLAERIGPFPHPTLNVAARASDTPKKQGTRMIKVSCPDTGYIARTSRKWLDEYGAPTCPCCHSQMEEKT